MYQLVSSHCILSRSGFDSERHLPCAVTYVVGSSGVRKFAEEGEGAKGVGLKRTHWCAALRESILCFVPNTITL
jgi:hypothetical protein